MGSLFSWYGINTFGIECFTSKEQYIDKLSCIMNLNYNQDW